MYIRVAELDSFSRLFICANILPANIVARHKLRALISNGWGSFKSVFNKHGYHLISYITIFILLHISRINLVVG